MRSGCSVSSTRKKGGVDDFVFVDQAGAGKGFALVWTLAEVTGAWLAFSWVSKQFSISHLVEISLLSLLLEQPDQVASRGPCRFGIAPGRQTVKLLGAPIPENPDVAP
jgi:hypothetical protein